MKCPRCSAEMTRRKVKEHSYQYRCPKCGNVIGAREEEERYTDAYKETLGKG